MSLIERRRERERSTTDASLGGVTGHRGPPPATLLPNGLLPTHAPPSGRTGHPTVRDPAGLRPVVCPAFPFPAPSVRLPAIPFPPRTGVARTPLPSLTLAATHPAPPPIICPGLEASPLGIPHPHRRGQIVMPTRGSPVAFVSLPRGAQQRCANKHRRRGPEGTRHAPRARPRKTHWRRNPTGCDRDVKGCIARHLNPNMPELSKRC